ncbi:MAG: ATP-binding protein [Clostridium sp.]|nr:ATP-binding protein [Clostridium sp.]
MKLKKNDRVVVKVTGRQRFTNKMMYEVEYENRKFMVPMFEFQKELPLPETLECLVSQVNGNSLYFKQNLSNLIRERYKEGQTCDFVVEQDYTATSNPHYKITDGSGFFFKLDPQPGIRLAKKSKIRCRIRKIRGIDVKLECVGAIHEMVEGFKIPVLTAKIGEPAARLISHFSSMEGLDDITDLYDDGNPEWLNSAAEFILSYFESLTVSEVSDKIIGLVSDLERVIVWFLEDSDYFDKFPEEERRRWQANFTEDLRRARALDAAFRVINDKAQEEAVNRVFSKIDASGYLIDADHKLRTIRNIFALDTDALRDEIGRISSVLTARRADIRADVSFRRAFVELLQLYIDNNRRALDEMDRAETNAARDQLEIMIKVIAMQLLLADPDQDSDISDPLNRTRLYRYLTLRDNSGNDDVIHKAVQALFACEKWKNEYSWRDVEEIIAITSRLRQAQSCETLPAVYETPFSTISASETTVEISQTGGNPAYQVYPVGGAQLWNNLSIFLISPLPVNMREPRTIPQFSRFWKELERRLTTAAPSSSSVESRLRQVTTLPVKNQRVEIEVIDVDPSEHTRLLCRIVERGLHGEGWLRTTDINGSDRELPLELFRDSSGRNRVYPAVVRRILPDESIEFSMTEPLDDFHNSYLQFDDIERCVILSRRGDSCMTLSENGFICNVEISEDFDHLKKGDVIEVTHIATTGSWREGEFVRAVSGRVDFLDVMSRLMSDFSLSDDDDDQEENESEENADDAPVQEANRMTEEAVRELARLVESVGAGEPQNTAAYNYFAYARLLAVIIGDSALAEYYNRRCTLLEELDDFFTNGHVDLQRLETMMPELARENNSLSTDLIKLRILSVIDHNENNAMLWNIFNSDANESLQELARLVLAYNMLDGFKMRDERLKIRQKLYSRLKMNIDKEPEVVAGGLEGLKTEFKTSIVYPANSMRIDVAEQTKVILKVIASFLNTVGGTLYIGVSDEGYVRGLEYDLKFFRSKDHFDRHIHDNIRRLLTYIPNLYNYIATEWVETAGKDIYKVTVSPISEPVAVDGVYYYREGSSCVMVRADQEKSFIEARRASAGVGDVAAVGEAAADQTDQARAAERPRQVRRIATSQFRNNVLHETDPGYQPSTAWLYVGDDLGVRLEDDDRWIEESCSLALALHPGEEEILMVSADGTAQRMELRAFEEGAQHFSSKLAPVFISPVGPGDQIVLIYRDSRGDYYKQKFDCADIHRCKPSERGALLSKDIATVMFCEVAAPESQQPFKALGRKQRIGKETAQFERERQGIIDRISKK